MTTLTLTALNQITRYGLLNGDWSLAGNWTFANTGLRLFDTGGDHYLNLVVNENLTANRVLNLITGDATRTITLSGNPTLGDWFNQSGKTTASPTFVGLNLSSTQLIDLTADVVGQRIQASAGHSVNLCQYEKSDGTVYSLVNEYGNFNVGAANTAGPNTAYYAYLLRTDTTSSYLFRGALTHNNAAALSNIRGIDATITKWGAGNVTYMMGANVNITPRYTTATLAITYGIVGQINLVDEAATAPTMTNVTCLYFAATLSRAIVGTFRGVAISTGSITSGSIGTAYGNAISQGTIGTGFVTDQYGLYIGSMTRAANNWSIYTNAGDVRLMSSAADKLGFHGVAPIAQQLLATGAGATVDNVISMLQTVGLCRQA